MIQYAFVIPLSILSYVHCVLLTRSTDQKRKSGKIEREIDKETETGVGEKKEQWMT